MSEAHEAHTEVAEAQSGGLPQLDIATYDEQIVWLVISFAVLFLIVSRAVLPRVTRVLEEREEKIATDLDTAERLKREAEDVKGTYEAALAEARKQAQDIVLKTKDTIQADIAKAQADLDADLGAKAAEAEEQIVQARKQALAGIDAVANEVAVELVVKLAGIDADDKAVAGAVKDALANVKGA